MKTDKQISEPPKKPEPFFNPSEIARWMSNQKAMENVLNDFNKLPKPESQDSRKCPFRPTATSQTSKPILPNVTRFSKENKIPISRLSVNFIDQLNKSDVDLYIQKDPIDYSEYKLQDIYQFPIRRIDAFSGVLHYITEKSRNKMNKSEFDFLYSSSELEFSSPFNVLDPSSPAYFATGHVPMSFFGVKFNNIRVKPAAYAIQSSVKKPPVDHLVTFLFQGKIGSNDKWVTLDEQCNTNKLCKPGAFDIFYLNTDIFFSKFRILQNGKSHAQNDGFYITAFDIHGEIEVIHGN